MSVPSSRVKQSERVAKIFVGAGILCQYNDQTTFYEEVLISP